jgi:divalent metal cation (Fe/Co/Zn/Cd) transporter
MGVEPRYLAEAEQAIAQVPGLSAVRVRGRWMGRSLILEIEGELPGKITLDQAAQIGQQVETAVHASVEEARQVHWVPRLREEPA